ncbi:MAG: glycosyltransferase [Alphaproteobacteria bacterium]|nr:glycosyltransferase [Alphaproteobacteria bacterium]
MKKRKGKITPKVSIIVPVYNVQGYLGKCLNSLLAQTLRDIEIICVNDGSTDDSLTILECFAHKDKRIKVIDQENSGPGVARNNGMQATSGEYIGFVDPDDWVKEDMYEKMYHQAKTLDSDIVICDYVRYQEWTNRIIPQHFFEKAVKYIKAEPVDIPSGENINRETLLDTLLISPCYSWNRIYRREFLKKNNLLFTDSMCYEDCPFILKSHILAQTVSYLDYAGYIYRLRKTSILRAYDMRYIDFCKIADNLNNFIASQKLSERMALNMHYFKTMNCAWTYNNLSAEIRHKFIKYIKKFLTAKEFYEMKKYCRIRFKDKIKKLFEKYVSVYKLPRHKVIKIFGITFKIKRRCGRLGAEQHYIQLVRKNYKKYPKDTYLLFDNLHDETAEAIDAYTLFIKMREKNLRAFYVLRKQTALYQKLATENKLENIIVLNFSIHTHPNEFVQKIHQVLYRTKCIITAFGETNETVDTFFKRHPSWQYIFIQHGPTFLKESVLYKGYLKPEKYDKYMVCSNREENLFLKYKFPKEELIKVGLPRWDLLKNQPKPKEKSILLMMTWRSLNKVTFENSLYKKNLLSLLHNEKLHSYLSQNDITLYFAPHHALLYIAHIDFDLSNEKNIQIIDTQNISRYIRKCSCLLTDFSSVAFDFMFQNKPVIFYTLDKDDTILNKYDKDDLSRFEYKQYILPNVYFDEEAVVNRVIEYCENNFKIDERTREIYDSFFYTKENIREQLIEKLEAICPNKQ